MHKEVIMSSATCSCVIERADVLDFLAGQPADSIDLMFFSPPYTGARLYLENGEDLGIARDAETWAAWMVEVFTACRRACRGLTACVCEGQTRRYRWDAAPVLLAADLHRAGFHLRRPCIYKRNGIPGSGSCDWVRADTEFIICTTRGGRLPWSNNVAMGRPPRWAPGGAMSHRRRDGSRVSGRTGSPRKPDGRRERQGYNPPALSNPGNVIDVGAVGGGRMGSDLAHQTEAPFAEQLAEFFIRSWCPPGGVVADPFLGSGTTAAVALAHGRAFVGCDVRQSQVELSRARVARVLGRSEAGNGGGNGAAPR
jgi:site-specific DNA-methyltransferase (adenine-specific)